MILAASLFAGIVFIVVATTRWKVHPFLALLVTALGVGLCGGLSAAQTLAALSSGFGRTVGAIGIVIACGCIIGTALEKSGCAQVLAAAVLRITGEKRAVLAMSGTGALVSIPVFCDSGFVILSPLTRSLARRTGESLAAFAVALSMGLYTTHCLVPPTPGPIAVASTLGATLGGVIGFGLLVAGPVLVATYVYACWIGRRIILSEVPVPRAPEVAAEARGASTSTVAASVPIVLPVLLIAAGSWADTKAFDVGEGVLRPVFSALGNPVLALLAGVLAAWWVVRASGRGLFSAWTEEGIRNAGMIILITAAGGAFGGVLRETPLGSLVGKAVSAWGLGAFNLVIPFAVAAGLKTAQGSSTVAMITTASLVAPLLDSLGLAGGNGPILATLSIAGGAMMLSHVNDSFFWVVTQLSGMSVVQGYKTVTVASGIAGLTALAAVLALGALML